VHIPFAAVSLLIPTYNWADTVIGYWDSRCYFENALLRKLQRHFQRHSSLSSKCRPVYYAVYCLSRKINTVVPRLDSTTSSFTPTHKQLRQQTNNKQTRLHSSPPTPTTFNQNVRFQDRCFSRPLPWPRHRHCQRRQGLCW
jgi:hypothetical protein